MRRLVELSIFSFFSAGFSQGRWAGMGCDGMGCDGMGEQARVRIDLCVGTEYSVCIEHSQ